MDQDFFKAIFEGIFAARSFPTVEILGQKTLGKYELPAAGDTITAGRGGILQAWSM
jgi:hypothetical protein